MQHREWHRGWLSLALAGSFLLFVSAWRRWLPNSLTETLGFITGVWCVWLVVRQNIWNFPIGIANNLFFLVLFLQARLFGDAGLQLIYLGLGVHGWHSWLRGGPQQTELKVARASLRFWWWLGIAVVGATASLTLTLRWVNGAAPLLDALTTVLSLAAQYLLNRKLLENWLLWMSADVLYIYLYLTRGLHLTALLYAIFLGLCVAGWLSWRRTLDDSPLKREDARAQI